ncbi:MAG: hypothetical protein KDB92_09590 [Chitinophagaceae bacterium]|nr:hypothetical protein [Chitinophagaceae bacterium]
MTEIDASIALLQKKGVQNDLCNRVFNKSPFEIIGSMDMVRREARRFR